MPLELSFTSNESLPIEAEGFTPDRLRGFSIDEIKRFEVRVGNQATTIGELCTVAGDSVDADWRITGDLSRVHYLGASMTDGLMRIDGPVGRHAGAQMQGGQLTIAGSASDWLGAEMRGGTIQLTGNAGNGVGAAYRGSPLGMRGGRIFVQGSAGDEVGHSLRRGWIVVGGNCGQLAGYRMHAGTLFVFGNCGSHPAAEMVRGTVGLFGHDHPQLLPTFRRACRLTAPVLAITNSELAKLGHATPKEVELYSGDHLTGGRGEVLLRV